MPGFRDNNRRDDTSLDGVRWLPMHVKHLRKEVEVILKVLLIPQILKFVFYETPSATQMMSTLTC